MLVSMWKNSSPRTALEEVQSNAAFLESNQQCFLKVRCVHTMTHKSYSCIYNSKKNLILSVDKDILEGAHARLFVVARSWSQPKYPLIGEIYKEKCGII